MHLALGLSSTKSRFLKTEQIIIIIIINELLLANGSSREGNFNGKSRF